MTAPTRPIGDLNAPLTQLQDDLRRHLAQQRVQAYVERAGWLILHPESATTPATAGERAELRHLLYDADADDITPAFPYPPEEATR